MTEQKQVAGPPQQKRLAVLVRLQPESKAWLDQLADKAQRNRSETVRLALAYAKKNEAEFIKIIGVAK